MSLCFWFEDPPPPQAPRQTQLGHRLDEWSWRWTSCLEDFSADFGAYNFSWNETLGALVAPKAGRGTLVCGSSQ
jgi:hypothetical protein